MPVSLSLSLLLDFPKSPECSNEEVSVSKNRKTAVAAKITETGDYR